MVFTFSLIDVRYPTDCMVATEPLLHPGNRSHLIVVYDFCCCCWMYCWVRFANRSLRTLACIFLRYWPVVLFFILWRPSLVLVSGNGFGSFPSSCTLAGSLKTPGWGSPVLCRSLIYTRRDPLQLHFYPKLLTSCLKEQLTGLLSAGSPLLNWQKSLVWRFQDPQTWPRSTVTRHPAKKTSQPWPQQILEVRAAPKKQFNEAPLSSLHSF